MPKIKFALALVALLSACGGGDSNRHPLDDTLRLNHIQVVGSHNSYHIQPRPALFAEIERTAPALAFGWEYTHAPLDEQFSNQGVRQIELDIFADPEGGLYASRSSLASIGEDPASNLPELDEPGLKVLHVQNVDFETTCLTFVSCLEIVRDWSDAHPGHVPITILVEAKDSGVPIQFGPTEMDGIDTEIRSVFSEDRMITPDFVRGDHETLLAAIQADGWPTLGEVRGRVLFALDNPGRQKDVYLEGHPSLRGRMMFTSSAPPAPEAAFVKENGPVGNEDRIRDLVAQGMIVRTRADADTIEGRTGATERRDAALASGAQFISSDYPVPNPAFGSGYSVQIPGGMPAGCNPVSAPAECTALAIEDPDRLR